MVLEIRKKRSMRECSGDDRNELYLDRRMSYTRVDFCQNSNLTTLRSVHFTIYKLYLNFKKRKKWSGKNEGASIPQTKRQLAACTQCRTKLSAESAIATQTENYWSLPGKGVMSWACSKTAPASRCASSNDNSRAAWDPAVRVLLDAVPLPWYVFSILFSLEKTTNVTRMELV